MKKIIAVASSLLLASSAVVCADVARIIRHDPEAERGNGKEKPDPWQ